MNVPPLRVSVTVDVSPGSVLPAESSTATVTAGLMFVPLVVGLGCCMKASLAAGP